MTKLAYIAWFTSTREAIDNENFFVWNLFRNEAAVVTNLNPMVGIDLLLLKENK